MQVDPEVLVEGGERLKQALNVSSPLKPQTPNLEPQTLDLEPQILNLEPQTLNPENLPL